MLIVSDIPIEVIHKNIKYIRLKVLPPDGRVIISSPHHVDRDRLTSFAQSKISWIQKHRARFRAQQRIIHPSDQYISGAIHYYQGDRYTLQVHETDGQPQVRVTNNYELWLDIKPHSNGEQKAKLLNAWYRHQLKQAIPPLLEKWEPIIQVEAKEWRIKSMKTRWGSCNIQAQRIWLNLDLITKPPICLEYVIVHELVHLLERYHNDRFKKLMTQFMPAWRTYKALLDHPPIR